MNPSAPQQLLASQICILSGKSQYSYPHMAIIPAMRSLSCHWSLDSSRGSSPQTAIYFFLFFFCIFFFFFFIEIPVSSFSRKLSSSCLNLLPFLQKRDWEGNSYADVATSFIFLYEECSFLPRLPHLAYDPPNWSSPSFSSTTLQNFQGIPDLISAVSYLLQLTTLCSQCSIHWILP